MERPGLTLVFGLGRARPPAKPMAVSRSERRQPTSLWFWRPFTIARSGEKYRSHPAGHFSSQRKEAAFTIDRHMAIHFEFDSANKILLLRVEGS